MHLGEYLRIILIKKGMKQKELVALLNKQKGFRIKGDKGSSVAENQMYYWVNGDETISPLMARRIEIALDLKKNTLVRFTTKNSKNLSDYNKAFGKEEGEDKG